MVDIKSIKLGLPSKMGVKLLVRVLGFDTNATTCVLYYEVQDVDGENLTNGNLSLNEEQFSKWSQDNDYLDTLVLNELGLEKLI